MHYDYIIHKPNNIITSFMITTQSRNGYYITTSTNQELLIHQYSYYTGQAITVCRSVLCLDLGKMNNCKYITIATTYAYH